MPRKKPTVDDVDPRAMAVDATPDEVRAHGDQDEAESAQLGDGAVIPVDEYADEHHLEEEARAQRDEEES